MLKEQALKELRDYVEHMEYKTDDMLTVANSMFQEQIIEGESPKMALAITKAALSDVVGAEADRLDIRYED